MSEWKKGSFCMDIQQIARRYKQCTMFLNQTTAEATVVNIKFSEIYFCMVIPLKFVMATGFMDRKLL